MIEIPNVTLYACSHCGRKFMRKHLAVYHEQHKCQKNPNNDHICFEGHGCKFLEKQDCIVGEDDFGNEYTSGTNFYCTKHDGQELFTYRQSKRKRFFLENISADALRMPIDCADYIEADIPF